MDKVMLITGSSKGIGAATARLAAIQGYHVCINYRNDEESAQRVARDCRNQGVQTAVVGADIGNADDVTRLFQTCDRELGPVSVLVNNAGIIGRSSRVADLADETLHQTFAVNVFGAFYCAREAVKRMSTNHGSNGGVIINISSIAARLGSPGEYVHYAASKGALDTFTVGLARELGSEGIRVNGIQAGTTDTGIHRESGNPDRPAMVARTAPLGRVAVPEDIAEAVIWLASDKASYATGSILPVSGGL